MIRMKLIQKLEQRGQNVNDGLKKSKLQIRSKEMSQIKVDTEGLQTGEFWGDIHASKKASEEL